MLGFHPGVKIGAAVQPPFLRALRGQHARQGALPEPRPFGEIRDDFFSRQQVVGFGGHAERLTAARAGGLYCRWKERLYRKLYEALVLGGEHELDAAVDAQFVVRLVQVHLDRPFGDREPLRDFLVPQAFRHQSHNLELARRQG